MRSNLSSKIKNMIIRFIPRKEVRLKMIDCFSNNIYQQITRCDGSYINQ